MRDNDGRKLDHKTLEVLRFRAVGQVAAGAHPEDVAAALGLNRTTVYRWLSLRREGGDGALRAKPVPGRPPKLTAEQARRVFTLVAGADPRQLQFEFALWTRDMVRVLIEREFGIALSASAVGRLLRRMGLSPQRPLWRAWQADAEKVEAWKTEQFPAIRARAKTAGATVYFGDEAGIRSDYHAGTTWGIVGKTPIVKATGARHSLNMISAITAQGLLRYSTYTGSLTGPVFIEFCKKLLADTEAATGRGVVLIVDGHPAHRAKKVKEWVARTEGRFELVLLPAYSPQLNPDEWVWKNIKHDRVGRTSPKTKDEFIALARAALRRLQRRPGLVRSFFGDPDLAYITA
ncbi:MAG: IS630 family transposase [Microbacteriaceae bacterium]